jgi:2-polyprenyl-3-methyl-5-hydroxy-6-metoxy-1,4-benzoquinol methylase
MRAVFKPFRFKVLPRSLLKRRGLRVLDVGCGSHSPTITKKWLGQCEYHGVDRALYRNDAEDVEAMDRFYELDLDNDDLERIPDNHYDLVLFSHVIEHLNDGERVLRELASKVRSGGYMYVETPSPRSLSLPSMTGTLNFTDDPTHVRLYRAEEIANTLLQAGLHVLHAGTRRDWLRVALTPIAFPLRYAFQREKAAADLWDIMGFATYALALRRD